LVAQLLGVAPDTITPGSLTYQLRRLRLRGLIVRIGAFDVLERPWTPGAPTRSSPHET
jgi:hypothetical protein